MGDNMKLGLHCIMHSPPFVQQHLKKIPTSFSFDSLDGEIYWAMPSVKFLQFFLSTSQNWSYKNVNCQVNSKSSAKKNESRMKKVKEVSVVYVTIIPRTTLVVLMEYKVYQLNFCKGDKVFFCSLLVSRKL